MKKVLCTLISIFKVLILKMYYQNKLHVKSILQIWGKNHKLVIQGKNAEVTIGEKNVTRENVVFRVEGGKLNIGDKCFFNSNVNITCIDEIVIGSGCQIAQNVVILDHDHNYKQKGVGVPSLVSSKVSIGKNVWIGANCVILRGSTIGDDVVIAAGSIVRGNIPTGTLFYQKREASYKNVITKNGGEK